MAVITMREALNQAMDEEMARDEMVCLFGEEVAECKHCNTKSHFTHLHEWVKIKGTCPTCQKKLVQEDLVSENI